MIALAILACGVASSSADTATRFVEQLRAEGHGDLVLEYLDRAADDPLVSDAFRERIPYERMATIVEQARSVADPAERLRALESVEPELRKLASRNDQAKSLLTDVADATATASADSARRRALEARRQAEGRPRDNALKTSRRGIDAARDRLGDAEKLIVAERECLKGVQPTSDEGERRADLGARLGLVRLLRARLLHEKAETYADKSKDRQQLNRDAAKQLGELYQKYSKWGVGLYAHLYEGRCYRLLGEKQLALAAIEDLTSQPAPTADLRRVVTLAHAERAALLRGIGKADEALEKPAVWLDDLSSGEGKGPEAATLRYQLALAALEKAEAADGAVQRKLQREAREWLGDAARVPSEVQSDARERWAAVTASLGLKAKPPKTFEEAVRFGGEAIQAMLAFDMASKGAEGAEADRLEGQRAESFEAAYTALSAAAKLADNKTPPAEAARARYQLAWLDWDRGDAEKAAERAEKVARDPASSKSAEQAARLALAALERLDRDGDSTASMRLQELAKYAIGRWPDDEIAGAAATVLISDALRSGDFAAAERLVADLPERQRTALSLRLAVASWEQNKSSAENRVGALAGLSKAFDASARKGDDSPLMVTAALYLAGTALDAADTDRARKLLRDPKHGPATRVASGTAPADKPVFKLAALKALLRVESLSGKSTTETIEQTAATISEAPAQQVGGDRAWLGVAVPLLADLQRVSDEPEAASVAATLASILERLGGVEQAGDWNTRLWIAQARLRCGESLADEAAAKASVEAGSAAFASLIDRAEATPGFAPSPTAVLAARLRLAECERELGEHAAAVETLTKMLASGAVLLDVQRVAAQTLQEWGEASSDANHFEEAIAGTRPGDDGKNLIWGWSKLAAIAGRFAGADPKRRDLYFEAWRNVAASRYESALLANGTLRSDQLRKAAGTIRALQRKNPELGGKASKRAFDRLLREIQKASGQQPTGLSQAGG